MKLLILLLSIGCICVKVNAMDEPREQDNKNKNEMDWDQRSAPENSALELHVLDQGRRLQIGGAALENYNGIYAAMYPGFGELIAGFGGLDIEGRHLYNGRPQWVNTKGIWIRWEEDRWAIGITYEVLKDVYMPPTDGWTVTESDMMRGMDPIPTVTPAQTAQDTTLATITVSGAGFEGCNGVYINFDDEKASGKMVFRRQVGSTDRIYWHMDGTWNIDNRGSKYEVRSTTKEPPTAGWKKTDSGRNPAPTIKFQAFRKGDKVRVKNRITGLYSRYGEVEYVGKNRIEIKFRKDGRVEEVRFAEVEPINEDQWLYYTGRSEQQSDSPSTAASPSPLNKKPSPSTEANMKSPSTEAKTKVSPSTPPAPPSGSSREPSGTPPVPASGSSAGPSGSSNSSNPSPESSDPIRKPTNPPEPTTTPQKDGDRIGDKPWWTATTVGQLTLSVLVVLAVGLLVGLASTAYRMRNNAEEPIEHDEENPAPLAEPIEIVIDPSVPTLAEQKMVVRAKHWRRVKEDEFIGKGSYGSVYLSWSDDLGTYFATKEIMLDDYLGGDEDMITQTLHAKRKELLARIANELILLRLLKHPNILQHFGEEISITKKRLYIFTEVMSGTIKDRLDKGTVIPNKLVARYGNDILAGLRYLHEHEPIVVHRDIKPSNLLIDKTGRIKLADFGTVKILDRLNDENTCRFPAGTYLFAPPEMHKQGKVTPAFDVWSLAITLHMMVTCHTPWPDQYTRNGIPTFVRWLNRTLAHDGIKLENPNLLANPEADVLKDMILGMLAVLPEDRPTVADIQQFPFFKNYDDTTPVTDAESPVVINKLTELMSKEDWRLTGTAVDSFDECKMSHPIIDATNNHNTQDEMLEEKKDTVDDSIVIEYGSTSELPPILEHHGGDSNSTPVLVYCGGDDYNCNTYDGSYRYSTDYDER